MADLGSEVTRGVPCGSLQGRAALRAAGGTPTLGETAPYEVDDFQAVALGQIGFRPLASRDDVAV